MLYSMCDYDLAQQLDSLLQVIHTSQVRSTFSSSLSYSFQLRGATFLFGPETIIFRS